MYKIEILPQYAFLFEAPQELADTVEHTLKTGSFAFNGDSHATLGDVELHLNPQFKHFTAWVNQCATTIKEAEGFECDDLSITQMWANMYDGERDIHMHQHTNSYMSAVYYVTDRKADTIFATDDYWHSNQRNVPCFTVKDTAYETRIETRVHARKGRLLFFPSGIAHCVHTEDEQTTGYTIAINFIPTGRVLSPFTLTSYDTTKLGKDTI